MQVRRPARDRPRVYTVAREQASAKDEKNDTLHSMHAAVVRVFDGIGYPALTQYGAIGDLGYKVTKCV